MSQESSNPYDPPRGGQPPQPGQPGQPEPGPYPQQQAYPPAAYPQPGGYGQPGYGVVPSPVYPRLADGTPLSPWGPCADWSQRFVGTLWDILYNWPAWIAIIVALLGFGVGAGLAAQDDTGAATGAFVFGGVAYLVALGLSLWRTITNLYLDQGRTGLTWGKRKVGIRLVRESDGQPAGGLMCFVRYLLMGLINQIVYLDVLWPLWDPKRQTLSDKILGHVVIKDPSVTPGS